MHAPRTPLHRDGDVRKTPRVRYSRTSKPARPHLCAGGCGGTTHLVTIFVQGVRGAQQSRSVCTTATLRVAVKDSRRRRFASPSEIHNSDASRRRPRFTTATKASLSEIHDGDAKIWTVIRSAYGQGRIIEFTFKIFLNVNSMIRDLPTVRIVSLNSYVKFQKTQRNDW